MINNDHFYIGSLIGKYIAGELSEDEGNRLEVWLNESKRNRDWFNKITSDNYKIKKIEDLQRVDREKGWQKFKIKQNKFGRYKLYIRWGLNAAAVILPLLVAVYLYTNTNKSSSEETVKKQAHIEPGYAKATLILSDGTDIRLDSTAQEKLQEKNGNIISLKDKQIKYSRKSDHPISKIAYNTLITPRGGEYELKLEDGTRIKLNCDSELKYPVAFGENERRVYLRGEAYFEVAKGKYPFAVNINGLEIKVLGTKFNISAYEGDDAIKTTLLEGSVNVKTLVDSLILSPGYQVSMHKEKEGLDSYRVDVDLYTGWVHNEFRFEGENLGDVMKKIARWYDIEVKFKDQAVMKRQLTARLNRFEDFTVLISMIERASGVNIDVNNRRVMISK
jgi:transmembrane sensor